MIGPLGAEARRVERLGRAVRDDVAALAAAQGLLAERLRTELRSPKVLLAIFAAGLGYGWLRGRPDRRDRADPDAEGGGSGVGRVAQLAAAVAGGIRILDALRRTVELAAPYAVSAAQTETEPPPFRDDGEDAVP